MVCNTLASYRYYLHQNLDCHNTAFGEMDMLLDALRGASDPHACRLARKVHQRSLNRMLQYHEEKNQSQDLTSPKPVFL
jgi:hypothetical protein